MAVADDLATRVTAIFAADWEERDGRVVPDPSDLKLGNDAINFDRATILQVIDIIDIMTDLGL